MNAQKDQMTKTNAESKESGIEGMHTMTPPTFQLFASTNANNGEEKELATPPGPDRCLMDGNDYFDEKGNYLYTDNLTQNGIRIILNATWVQISNQFSKILWDQNHVHQDLQQELETKSLPLSKLSFDTPEKKANVGRLMDFYLEMMGYSPSASSAKESARESTMATGVDGSSQKHIYLSLKSNQTIRFSYLADNKFNFRNTLVHEKCHFESHYLEDKSQDGRSHFESIGTEMSESKEACLRHLESYYAQMQHETWEKTDETYKVKRIQWVGAFLAYLKDHELREGEKGELSDFWCLKFQKDFHFQFSNGKINGDPEMIEVAFTK